MITEQKPQEEQKSKKEPTPARTQVDVDQTISTYNGGETAKYRWSQSISSVDVQMELPEGTIAKNLLVKMKAKSIEIRLKSSPADSPPLLAGEFCEKINTEDSFWSVEEKKFLNLNMEKAYEAIWKNVLMGDPEIDTTKVDNSKRIDEFDTETQGHLQKVMYE